MQPPAGLREIGRRKAVKRMLAALRAASGANMSAARRAAINICDPRGSNPERYRALRVLRTRKTAAPLRACRAYALVARFASQKRMRCFASPQRDFIFNRRFLVDLQAAAWARLALGVWIGDVVATQSYQPGLLWACGLVVSSLLRGTAR